jgi:hypothetical protein
MYLEVEDRDIEWIYKDEGRIRKEYETLVKNDEVWEEDDLAEVRMKLFEEMSLENPNLKEEFDRFYETELAVFKEDERYNFGKDLKRAY